MLLRNILIPLLLLAEPPVHGLRHDSVARPGTPAARAAAATLAAPSAPAQAAQQAGVSLDDLGYDFGPAMAATWVVEFMDYGCGYCAKFSTEAFPQLNQEYVAAGRIRWKFVPFVVGMFPNSENAAVAAECAAAQGKFLLMSDSLYATRKEWMTTHEPQRVMARLARATRLNQGAFAKCTAGSAAVARVRQAGLAARAVNIRGTPTFFINGQRIDGAIPLPLFRQVLSRILDRPAR